MKDALLSSTRSAQKLQFCFHVQTVVCNCTLVYTLVCTLFLLPVSLLFFGGGGQPPESDLLRVAVEGLQVCFEDALVAAQSSSDEGAAENVSYSAAKGHVLLRALSLRWHEAEFNGHLFAGW